MAIDTTLFAADIPAGTYAVGDVIQLGCIAGPANVRSGRGNAILKNMVIGRLSAGNAQWSVHIKNSDWIDEVISIAGSVSQATALDGYSGLVQLGCDDTLTPNSGWNVYAVCESAGTPTTGDSIFALIDIDYPSVSAITNPDTLVGIPTSIKADIPAANVNAIGAMSTATWQSQSVDYFKAGFQYCLQAVEVMGTPTVGFVAFSNAAGMGGLQRIVPVNNNIHGIRYKIRYASKLVKGPMEIKTMFFAGTAGTGVPIVMIHDYVKKGQ